MVYQLRPDAGAIAHLHPPYATAYSNKERPLPLVTVSSRADSQGGSVGRMRIPGSKELCDFVHGGIKKHPTIRAMLMKEHGILTLGSRSQDGILSR